MGLPAKVSRALTTSNYLNLENGNLESLASLRASIKTSDNLTLSVDAGVSNNISYDKEKQSPVVKTLPYTEVKCKYNIYSFSDDLTLSGYGRQRITGDELSERLSLGLNYKINDRLSAYLGGHCSASITPDATGYKAGAWLGLEGNSKAIPGLNSWFELPQVNAKLGPMEPGDKRFSYTANFGVTYNF